MKKRIKKNADSSLKPVALVTGATSALGAAISRKLVSQGYHLVLHYGRSESKAMLLQKELEAKRVEVSLLQADLSDPASSAQVVEKVIARWGRLDLLVNNASLFEPTPLSTQGWEKWNEIFTVNTFAPVRLALEASPWLKKSGGCVVNITDIYGEFPVLKEYAAYSASKAGLIFLTRYLALALGEKVRVNAVSPGVITFPSSYTGAQKRKLVAKAILKRKGSVLDIANAVWFLVSSSFVTGQVLRVDGGRFIR